MGLRLNGKGQQSHRMVIFLAIFILMTLLFLYGSNNGNDAVYAPFHVATNHPLKNTDLKKWGGKDGYVPFYGNKSMTLHCHNCALVTSSSHVLGTQAGEEIDHTECVIRMNDAPTLGYETDVGSRTSLRVVAHSSVFRVVRRPNEFLHRTDNNPVIIFWGPPNKIGKDAKGTLYRLIQRVSMTYSNFSFFSITSSKMRRFDSLFHKETGRDRQKSHSWLSTGWFTMVIAIEICDNIKVYGMVPPNHCGKKPGSKKMPYHYYKPRGVDECVTYIQNEGSRRGNHHRFITEKQVFARWAKQYNITFTNPKWSKD
ncbi:alpha-N-acetylgalactosaminide alpha-2,6-sialyltransferase 6 [Seriola lalandi dorsalis]|uniref:Alpha-N-acetylgalactosaminide alpha-2,6-sialyltransferase 6 n=2 Tax=Seriola TaxID=8160 RepID=A0A3B4TWV9_SERDU|nr:alpha-N-acetylgalactosaminide alpha-2,6-sialyltransferase 6 [Seriola dumerili]XP_022622155.1 alpha-N-acetylgalactosaminide alpha-2,6-sialyltransferase 6 [Seriola dumerili]XP_022622156.1 alpha-N-acetylgalactosaminide alpha-2,6-sialyltransferase 6 [Seriola dumerili]XP_023279761.1 alpha-N-acetylgalactosaminide alpha-2,6-sialyltransferase 6 [Seriola lalandi dorsalis]XP_023279762.1 alpha-N-acetylgalactosaminide alpha-2,6-sialyltransferase 6 [Seriola lalandi dorsalis]XP_023279763.1 alpha-N-acetyl